MFTVIGGPNGAGKSTLFGVLRDRGFAQGPFVNTDDIARTIGGDDATGDLRAGKETLRLTAALIAKRTTFTRESTLSGREILRAMAKAKERGFRVDFVFVGVARVATSKARVANRVALGGHDIPDEVQERRFARTFANAAAAVRIAEQSALYDNGARGHELIAEVRRGVVVFRAERAPAWSDRMLHGLDDGGERR